MGLIRDVETSQVSGVLNIDKPAGCSSHDVVARVRKLSRQRRVGHTGTLDPLATGVLIVGLGQATRLIEFAMSGRKQYRAVLHFGISTDTLDAEGEIIDQRDPSGLTLDTITEILSRFKGELQQVPPIFSAIKQAGQPLYKRARAGQAVDAPPPRPVHLHQVELVAWQPPLLTIEVTCSAGTYIRALARDIGAAAGSGAHLAGLIRTANGPWTVAEAVTLDQLSQAAQTEPAGWQKYLQPMDRLVLHLPQVVLDERQSTAIRHGRQVQLLAPNFEPEPHTGATDYLRAYTAAGDFLAILTVADRHENLWQPKKVFQV